MASSTTGPGNVLRRRLPLLVVAIIAIALVLPAAVYGGFMVSVATVTFSETTGSLTASTPQASVSSTTVYNYVALKMGGTLRTSDQAVSANEVARVTIALRLLTPSGQNVTVSVLNIQGGIGTREHRIVLGPGEGVRQSGVFLLTINISVDITTPAGVNVTSLSLSMTKTFTVP